MNIERNILEKLSLVHPRMLKETTLLADVRLDAPETSLGDLRASTRKLDAKEQVIILNDEDATRLKITAAGQARILER